MSLSSEAPQGRCQFGVARRDVTPPVGIYHRMWGAATHDRSTGVHRPLTGTALVFAPLDEAAKPADVQVLVALDHCLMWTREMEGVLAAICGRNGLAREQVVVTFGHTHAAGLMGLERVGLPGGELIPPYLEWLGAALAEAVAEALGALQPATIVVGMGYADLAANRDLFDAASGQWVCGFNPDGPADRSVVVARVTTDGGQADGGEPLATLVNYGCHPTTLAWDNTLISPDYPGALRELVERETGAPCVFVLGASGEVGPREGFVGDTAVADHNGRQVGHAALAALEGLPPALAKFVYSGPVVSGATIGTWRYEPLDDLAREELARYRVKRWTVPLPYPTDAPTVEEMTTERETWREAERSAQEAGDVDGARDARAMVERTTRWLRRHEDLPAGAEYPYPVTMWQVGRVVWVAVEGEPYQLLQVALRARFPELAIVVAVLANGSRCSYLPTRESYGTGLYQESVAVLAAGCLERLVEGIARELEGWQRG